MKECSVCHGFGRHQVYRYGRVSSVYCDCDAGRQWLERLKKEFEARGIDTSNPSYPWNIKKDS